MGGAQPLAASLAGAALPDVEVDPHRIARRLETRLPGRGGSRPGRRRQARGRAADEGAALSIGVLGNAGEVFPELARRGFRPRPGHRPDLGARHAERLRARGLDAREARRAARARPGRLRAPRPRDGGRARARRWSPSRTPAATCSTTATTSAPRRWTPASPTPSRSPASCPPTSGRCSARAGPVPLGGAVRRSGRHRPHRPGAARGLPRRRPAAALARRSRRERIAFQGLPARICWLG